MTSHTRWGGGCPKHDDISDRLHEWDSDKGRWGVRKCETICVTSLMDGPKQKVSIFSPGRRVCVLCIFELSLDLRHILHRHNMRRKKESPKCNMITSFIRAFVLSSNAGGKRACLLASCNICSILSPLNRVPLLLLTHSRLLQLVLPKGASSVHCS